MSWLFSEVILRRKHRFKRNLGSPVKNCSKVSLIYLSESVRRGSISFDCDRMRGHPNFEGGWQAQFSSSEYRFS